MKSKILILMLAVIIAGCKKEPVYYPKPDRNVYQIISETDGLVIKFYDESSSSSFTVYKGETEEYSTAEYAQGEVICPSGVKCLYYFNGIKFNHSIQFTRDAPR